jgi:hypothetical protein
VPYRQGRPPRPRSRIEHRFHGRGTRIVMLAAILLTLGVAAHHWPDAVEDQVFRCVRSQATCSLETDRSFLGIERESFPLSSLRGVRMPPHADDDDTRWEVVLATTQGDRRLRSCERRSQCRAVVEQTARFLSGSEERLEIHEPCSALGIFFLIAMVALVAGFPLHEIVRRVSLTFDWDAAVVEARWHASFGRPPVTLSLEGAPKATIREERQETDGGEVIKYEVVLDTRDRDVALGFGDRDAQLALVREVNDLLAAHLPR